MATLRQPQVPTHADQMQDYLVNWNAGPLGVVLQPDLGADMPPVVAQLLPRPSMLKMAGVQEGDLLISVNGKKTTCLGYEKVVRLLFKERLPMVLHFRSPVPVSEASRGVLGGTLDDASVIRGRGHSRTKSALRANSVSRNRRRCDVEQLETKRNEHARISSNEREDASFLEKKKQNKNDLKCSRAEAEDKRLRKQYSVIWERGSLGISFRAYNSKVNVPCVDFISAKRGHGRGMDRVCINDVLVAINGEKTKTLGVEKVLRWLHVIEKPVVLRFHASSNRITNPAGTFLSQIREEVPFRSRRATVSHSQPENERPTRPPRRNNSVDRSALQREVSEDKEVELNLATASRSSLKEGITNFEKQPVENDDLQYQLDASSISVNEIHQNQMNVHVESHEGDTAAGDFLCEPMDPNKPQVEAHTKHKEEKFHSQFQKVPSRLPVNLNSRDVVRCEQQSGSKPALLPVTTGAAPAPSRRSSQTSNLFKLSFQEVVNVVARAAGMTAEECEFGGTPLLEIKEGTVQAKLLYIYAKACFAQESDLDNDTTFEDHQWPRISGNPLGRKTSSKHLSYTVQQNNAVESNITTTDNISDADDEAKKKHTEFQGEVTNTADNGLECKQSGVFSDNLAESLAKMQKDISIQQPAQVMPTTSFSSACSTLVSRDKGSIPNSAPTATRAEDFIPLNYFTVEGDGKLTERRTTLSRSSRASVFAADESENKTLYKHQDTMILFSQNEETVADACMNSVASKPQSIELNKGLGVDCVQSEDGKKQSKDYTWPEREHDYADEDVASDVLIDERDLAASVASLDDLLDLPSKDDVLYEEHEEFADDDDDAKVVIEKDEKDGDVVSPLRSPLGSMLDQVQEEEIGESEDFDDHSNEKKEVKQVESKERQLENIYKDGALSDLLVNELYCGVQDVHEVIKDKSAILVLVKKSMVDEIQKILQSLQMELQLERHSTVAVGSSADPLPDSQQGQSVEGEHCYRCGAANELAELDVAGGRRELYCEECWELYFFSEENQSPETTPLDGGQFTTDETALDEALKYSFHDSSITCEDMISPWRSLQGNDSLSSSFRDSDASSITDRADEVWL